MSERLDRCLVNFTWWQLFTNASVIHGLVAYSDHIPIWVDMEGIVEHTKAKRLFKFEAMQVGDQACEEIIKESWGRCASQSNISEVMDSIKHCGIKLNDWNRQSFGHV